MLERPHLAPSSLEKRARCPAAVARGQAVDRKEFARATGAHWLSDATAGFLYPRRACLCVRVLDTLRVAVASSSQSQLPERLRNRRGHTTMSDATRSLSAVGAVGTIAVGLIHAWPTVNQLEMPKLDCGDLSSSCNPAFFQPFRSSRAPAWTSGGLSSWASGPQLHRRPPSPTLVWRAFATLLSPALSAYAWVP